MLKWDSEAFLNSVSEALDNRKQQLVANVDSALELIHNTSNQFAPVDTGEMIDDSGYFTRLTSSQIIGTVGYMPFYSIYVHQGTGIYALNGDGRQISWFWYGGESGKWAGWHHTHGQRPKRFLYKAFLEYEDEINWILAEGV